MIICQGINTFHRVREIERSDFCRLFIHLTVLVYRPLPNVDLNTMPFSLTSKQRFVKFPDNRARQLVVMIVISCSDFSRGSKCMITTLNNNWHLQATVEAQVVKKKQKKKHLSARKVSPLGSCSLEYWVWITHEPIWITFIGIYNVIRTRVDILVECLCCFSCSNPWWPRKGRMRRGGK